MRDVPRDDRPVHVRLDDAHAVHRAARVWGHRRRRCHCGPCPVGDGWFRHRFRVRHEAHEVVSAPDAADVHFHGLRPVGVQDRGRSLPDVSRLDGPGTRRPRHRHDRPDDPDLRDERPLRRGHGHRRNDCPAGIAEARLRQADGDRGHPGRLVPRHSRSALRRAGALRHDRASARGPALARRRVPRADDGRPVHDLHLHPVPDTTATRTGTGSGGSRTLPSAKSSACCARGCCRCSFSR